MGDMSDKIQSGIGALDALIEEMEPRCPWCKARYTYDDDYGAARIRHFACYSETVQVAKEMVGSQRSKDCLSGQMAAILETLASEADRLGDELRGRVICDSIEEGRKIAATWMAMQ